MKTLNQKKYNWTALLLILICVLGGVTLYFIGEPNDNTLYKNKVLKDDSAQVEKIKTTLQNQNNDILKLIAVTDQPKVKPVLEQNLKVNINKFKEIQKEKNTLIFPENQSSHDAPLKLCIIIIVCGILGGLASGYYRYLEDMLQANNEVKQEALEMKQLCEKFENQGITASEVKPMTEAIQNVENKMEVLLDKIEEEKNKSVSRILFGVISSFFAVLILKAGDSKVLEFNTYLDYFVFACYCLLCALFSKKIIETLINTFVKGIGELNVVNNKK